MSASKEYLTDDERNLLREIIPAMLSLPIRSQETILNIAKGMNINESLHQARAANG